MKIFQEDEYGGIIILDDLNEKEINDPRVQAMFKQSRHNNLSVFIISLDYYEIPNRTIRAIGYIYHIFKPNISNKAFMDMTFIEFKKLTNFCGKEEHQPITIDMTNDKYCCRYRLGLNSIFVPNSNPI